MKSKSACSFTLHFSLFTSLFTIFRMSRVNHFRLPCTIHHVEHVGCLIVVKQRPSLLLISCQRAPGQCTGIVISSDG